MFHSSNGLQTLVCAKDPHSPTTTHPFNEFNSDAGQRKSSSVYGGPQGAVGEVLAADGDSQERAARISAVDGRARCRARGVEEHDAQGEGEGTKEQIDVCGGEVPIGDVRAHGVD